MTIRDENLVIARWFAGVVNGRSSALGLEQELSKRLAHIDRLRKHGDDENVPDELNLDYLEDTLLYSSMLVVVQSLDISRSMANSAR